jgi:hypothetical protein
MAKLNEGDIVEGLFTIALALHLAYGKVDKSALNKIRTQIDTKMFNTGRFKYTVASKLKRQKDKNPPDLFNVGFEMRLKPQSVQGAFDKEYEVLYKSSKDVGNIDMKINQLITSFKSASFAKKANDAVNYFLDNNASDDVTFTVIADGIAGESSGGELKGDVTLEVYATAKNSNKKIISGSLPFSLKSESVTVANLSPYHGMLDFAKAMGIDWDAKEKYIRLSKPFNGPIEQKAKFKLITEMYNELKDEIVKKSKDANFSKTAYAFLRKSIFGSDLANVVDVQRSTVKEITVEHFDELEKKTKLIVKVSGNNLIFEGLYKFDNKFTFNLPIFQIRTKLRPPPANEAKFYLEVGKGIYSK